MVSVMKSHMKRRDTGSMPDQHAEAAMNIDRGRLQFAMEKLP